MADARIAQRRPKLSGKATRHGGLSVKILPAAERLSLRAPTGSVAALSSALKIRLPNAPKTSAKAGTRTSLWLGPDEWLVIDEGGGDPLADCRSVTALHSAVGISHRNVAIEVSGPGAEACLNSGCPRDLSLHAFGVGACSRTILGKVEIVLYRSAEDTFRVEVWRSFSDYVFEFLSVAAKDVAG